MHKKWDYKDCGHVLLGVIEGTSSFIEDILRVRSRFGGASSSSQVGGVEPGTTRHVALKRHTREKVKISLGDEEGRMGIKWAPPTWLR